LPSESRLTRGRGKVPPSNGTMHVGTTCAKHGEGSHKTEALELVRQ